MEPSIRDDLPRWQRALEDFISSLDSLVSLKLSGTLHGSLLSAITASHGQTLEELVLNPYAHGYDMPSPPYRVSTADFELLASNCPRLRSLSLTLKRTMGDRTETRFYEAISTHLIHFSLQISKLLPINRSYYMELVILLADSTGVCLEMASHIKHLPKYI